MPVDDVLIVNAGSTSLKLSVVGPAGTRTVEQEHEVVDLGSGWVTEVLRELTSTVDVDVIGHRVVHGGSRYRRPTLIDDEVRREVASLSALAPLHQAPSLAGIDGARSAFPDLPHVACFDTAFHADLPVAAVTYALPEEWRRRWDLRRFGFHGLSHAWVAHRAPGLVGAAPGDVRVVSCHLGGGSSLCAIRNGRSFDTTMGFTPLEGLVMATRSGDVDPGLLLYLITGCGIDPAELGDGLQRRSGLLGLTGESDVRQVIEAIDAGEDRAVLGFEVMVHRLRGSIASMVASLGGVDVLAFTGGVGAHLPRVRAAVTDGLAFLGVVVDGERNDQAIGVDRDISAAHAAVRTVVLRAGEDLQAASEVRALIGAG